MGGFEHAWKVINVWLLCVLGGGAEWVSISKIEANVKNPRSISKSETNSKKVVVVKI